MPTIVIRLAILAVVAVIAYIVVWSVRRYIAAQRRSALAAVSYQTSVVSTSDESQQEDTGKSANASIRILAFSSPDCHQCHQLQTPALQRVVKARPEGIKVLDVDATTEAELVKTYHILTVPSTVILDRLGQAHAVNYGFANTQRLLQQVDELLMTTRT
jgi:thioredoxin-like negative regulator of GroEL